MDGALMGWYKGGFKYRKKITFNRVYGTLTDFPVGIQIKGNDSLFTNARVDGKDILFTMEDGYTKLWHEMSIYTTVSGLAYLPPLMCAYVKIPVLSSGTSIYMYYGNPTYNGVHGYSQDNPKEVWSNGFYEVWHFDAMNHICGSLNGTYGVRGRGGGTTVTSGSIGRGRQFVRNYSNDYVNYSVSNINVSTLSNFTVECVFSAHNNTGELCSYDSGSGGISLAVSGSRTQYIMRGTSDASTESSSTFSLNNWCYSAGSHDSFQRFRCVYLNDEQTYEYFTGFLSSTGVSSFYIGRKPHASANYFGGIISEVRLSSVSRSADWCKTTYENLIHPETFYTIGQEEDVGGMYINTWLFRQKLTVPASVLSGTLYNFPVVVELYDRNNHLFKAANHDGSDIIFTDSDGETLLSYMIDSFSNNIDAPYTSTSGAYCSLTAHVKIPTLSNSTDNVFYMYYGNKHAYFQESSYDVWDSDFIGVLTSTNTYNKIQSFSSKTVDFYSFNTDNFRSNYYGLSDEILDERFDVTNLTSKGALKFVASNNVYMNVPYVSGNSLYASPITSRFTYTAWVYVNSTGQSYSYAPIVGRERGGGQVAQRDLTIEGLSSGPPYGLRLRLNDTAFSITANGVIPADKWVFVACTYDKDASSPQAKIYVNGTIVASGTYTSVINETGGTGYYMGGSPSTTSKYMSGLLDEVKIYNRALSDSEILYWYNNGYGVIGDPNEYCLVGWWHFDDVGAGATCYNGGLSNTNGSTCNGTVTNYISRVEGIISNAIIVKGGRLTCDTTDLSEKNFTFTPDGNVANYDLVIHFEGTNMVTKYTESYQNYVDVVVQFNGGYKLYLLRRATMIYAIVYDSGWNTVYNYSTSMSGPTNTTFGFRIFWDASKVHFYYSSGAPIELASSLSEIGPGWSYSGKSCVSPFGSPVFRIRGGLLIQLRSLNGGGAPVLSPINWVTKSHFINYNVHGDKLYEYKYAYNFDGLGSQLNCVVSTLGAQKASTVSAFLYPDTCNSPYNFIGVGSTISGTVSRYSGALIQVSPTAFQHIVSDSYNNVESVTLSGAVGQWNYLAGSIDLVNGGRVYADNTQVVSGSSTLSGTLPFYSSPRDFVHAIGHDPTFIYNQRVFDGKVREYRFSKIARSKEWIAAERDNFIYPHKFIQYSFTYDSYLNSLFSKGWKYRKKVLIKGSDYAGSNYSVRFIVANCDNGEHNYDFSLDYHSENFPYDMRFTLDDGVTVLHHWVEVVYGNIYKVAIVWVNVPVNLSQNQSIYCYYGNNRRGEILNLRRGAFLGFDKFDIDGSVERYIYAAYPVSGKVYAYNKVLHLVNGLNSTTPDIFAYLKSFRNIVFNSNVSTRVSFYPISPSVGTNYNRIFIYDVVGSYLLMDYSSTKQWILYIDNVSQGSITNPTPDNLLSSIMWNDYYLYTVNSGTVNTKIIVNNYQLYSVSTSPITNRGTAVFRYYRTTGASTGTSPEVLFNFIWTRKYTNPEPHFDKVGEEEGPSYIYYSAGSGTSWDAYYLVASGCSGQLALDGSGYLYLGFRDSTVSNAIYTRRKYHYGYWEDLYPICSGSNTRQDFNLMWSYYPRGDNIAYGEMPVGMGYTIEGFSTTSGSYFVTYYEHVFNSSANFYNSVSALLSGSQANTSSNLSAAILGEAYWPENSTESICYNGTRDFTFSNIYYDSSYIPLINVYLPQNVISGVFNRGVGLGAYCIPTVRPLTNGTFRVKMLTSYIYTIGGQTNSTTYSTTIERYESLSNSNATRNGLATARSYFSSYDIQGFGYIMGGSSSGGVSQSSVERHDDYSDSVVYMNPMMLAFNSSHGFEISNNGYLLGGRNSSGGAVAVNIKFDPYVNSYSTKSDLVQPCYLGWSSSIDGYGFRMLGYNPYGVLPRGDYGLKLTSVDRYDSVSNVWTITSNSGPSVYDITNGSVVASLAYVLCGYDWSANLSNIFRYSAITCTWVYRNLTTTARRGNTQAAVTERSYSMAGYTTSAVGNNERHDDISNSITNCTTVTARYGIGSYTCDFNVSYVAFGSKYNQAYINAGSKFISNGFDYVDLTTPHEDTNYVVLAVPSGVYNYSLTDPGNFFIAPNVKVISNSRFEVITPGGLSITACGKTASTTYVGTTNSFYDYTNSVTTLNNFTSRAAPSSFSLQGSVFVVGGTNGSDLTTHQSISVSTNSITSRAVLGTARYSSFGASMFSYGFICGGKSSGSSISMVERYDYVSNSWLVRQNMGMVRENAGCVSVMNKLYIVGGYSSGTSTYLGSAENFDDLSNSWAASLRSYGPIYYPASWSQNGFIFIQGGSTTGGSRTGRSEKIDYISNTSAVRTSISTRTQLGGTGGQGSGFAAAGYNGSDPGLTTNERTDDYTNTVLARATITARYMITSTLSFENGIYYVTVNPSYVKNSGRKWLHHGDTRLSFVVNQSNTNYSTITCFSNPSSGTGFVNRFLMRSYVSIYTSDNTISGCRVVYYRDAYPAALCGSGASTYLGTIETYGGLSNSWTSRTSATARHSLGAFGMFDHIWTSCGYTGSFVGTTERYDVEINSHISRLSVPTSRSSTSCFTISGSAFITGGATAISPLTAIQDVQRYDDYTNSYTSRTGLTTARARHATYAFDGRGFTCGGATSGDNDSSVTERFDDLVNVHVARSNLPSPVQWVSGVSINNYGFTVGGSNGASVVNWMNRFDDVVNGNLSKPNLPESKKSAGVSNYDGCVFVVGGWTTTYVGTSHRFDDYANTYLSRASATARYQLACTHGAENFINYAVFDHR